MKITKLSYQVKNPSRVNVFVDNKYSFSLDEGEVLTESLKTGLDIDEARIKKLQKLSEDGKIKMRALDWLMRRPHSIREFNDYCYRKKIDKKLTETLIDEFIQKGYLNDESFASWFFDMRQAKNKSTRAITSELQQKGVANDIISQLKEQNDISANDEQALSALVTKTLQKARYQNDDQKLIRYLMGKGFSYQQIRGQLEHHRQRPMD